MPHPRALLQLSGISRTRIHPVRELGQARSCLAPAPTLPLGSLPIARGNTQAFGSLHRAVKRPNLGVKTRICAGDGPAHQGSQGASLHNSITFSHSAKSGMLQPCAGSREPGEPLQHIHPDQRRGGREPGHRGCCCQSLGGSQTPPWRVPEVLVACPLGKGTTPSEHPEPPGPAARRGRDVGEEPLTTA